MTQCIPGGAHPCAGNVPGMGGALLAQLIQSLAVAQCALGNAGDIPQDIGSAVRDEYDFIVVGGGTAGSVVARLLSDAAPWTVLLIESGGDPPMTSEIPGLLFSLQHTEIDWKYRTIPQKRACRGIEEGRCRWPRGRVLGGCSTINAMLYVTGNRRDYDGWEAEGNPGWGYEDISKYFARIDNGTSDNTLHVQYFGDRNPVREALLNAAKEMGYEYLKDTNCEYPMGFGTTPATVKNGRRYSTARSHLAGARNKNNLHVAKFGLVTKIEIDSESKTATGVRYIQGGDIRTVRARKEVVVSAGSINSPQLLLLSGIGPRRLLEEIKISPVHQDSPVGQNLQDHLIFLGLVFAINKGNPTTITRNQALDEIYNYFTKSSGLLSTIGVTDIIGFIDTRDTSGNSKYPNIQFHYYHVPTNDTILLEMMLSGMEFNQEIRKSLFQANRKSDLLWILPTLLHPKSKGQVTLVSDDPLEYPLIDPRYYEDDDDVNVMLEAIDVVKKMSQTGPMQGMESELVPLPFSGCGKVLFDSPEYWRCALSHMTSTVYHPTGTCRMGTKSNANSVVDARLRVHGIQHLRVIDASVMPEITSGNTNAPTIMIASKGADMIASDWKPRDEL